MRLSENKQVLRLVNNAIEELSPDQQEACRELAEFIQTNLRRAGDPVGILAFALVCAEHQVNEGVTIV